VSLVGQQVVQPIGYRPAEGVAQEVMSVDLVRSQDPGRPTVAEVTDQLFLLGVHAEDRQSASAELRNELLNVAKLAVTVGVVRPREPLDVDPQVVAQVTQQTGDGRGARFMAQTHQFVAEVAEAATDEPVVGHRVATSSRLDQRFQVVEDSRVFFFPGGRPAPGLRTRSVGRSWRSASSSSRPRRTVSTCRPVMRASRVSPP
jgi:hypothetical protein